MTGRNFDSVVAKFLDSSVASVFFFKPGDAEADFTMSPAARYTRGFRLFVLSPHRALCPLASCPWKRAETFLL